MNRSKVNFWIFFKLSVDFCPIMLYHIICPVEEYGTSGCGSGGRALR